MYEHKPTTYRFNQTQRINGWAKLIHVTPSGGVSFTIDGNKRCALPYVIDSAPVERIENKPCHPPIPAIRKWKIWLMSSGYRKNGPFCKLMSWV